MNQFKVGDQVIYMGNNFENLRGEVWSVMDTFSNNTIRLHSGKIYSATNFIINPHKTLTKRKGYTEFVNPIVYTHKYIAKELLKIEYLDVPISDEELKDTYKKLFNLSQEEIDQLVQETLDLAEKIQEPKQLPLFGINTEDYQVWKDSGFLSGKSPEILKKECEHDWKTYVGLNETDTYCTKCKVTK